MHPGRARCTAGTAAHPTNQSAVADDRCRHIDVPAGTYNEDVIIGRDGTSRGMRGRTSVKGGNIVGENTEVLLLREGRGRLEGLTIQSDTQNIPSRDVGRAVLIVKNGTILGNDGGDIYPPLAEGRR